MKKPNLIEVLIAIVVAGIATAVVYPLFTRQQEIPHSCEYYLTGAGTYSDSLIIKRDSSQCQ